MLVAATGMQPSGGVSQEGWERERKIHRVQPCVTNDFSATTTQCFVTGPRHASPSVQSPPLQQCPEVSRAAQTRRSRPQCNNRGSNHSGVHVPGSDSRIEQEARGHNPNSSPVGPHAKRQTDVELGSGQHSVCTGGSMIGFLHWSNTPTAPGDIAGRDEFCCPGIVISDPRRKRDATHGGSLGKAEANRLVCLSDSQSC